LWYFHIDSTAVCRVIFALSAVAGGMGKKAPGYRAHSSRQYTRRLDDFGLDSVPGLGLLAV
jgi:hypothetical protein